MCPGSTIKSLCVYRVKTRLLVRSFRPFQKNGETAAGWRAGCPGKPAVRLSA